MTITATVTHFDPVTGEQEVTYSLEPDRRFFGFAQYAIDGLAVPSQLHATLEALRLEIVGYDILTLTDWAMHRGLGSRLYLAWQWQRGRYWQALRRLCRWHLIDRPSGGECFSWRQHFRPLGPLRHWQMKRRAVAAAIELERQYAERWPFDWKQVDYRAYCWKRRRGDPS